MPRTAPVVKSNEINTEDMGVAQPKAREQKVDGPAMESLSRPKPETGERVKVATHLDKEWAANIAFSREMVTVRVNESPDENAEKIVEVWNNGEIMRFPRGSEVTCERRFVESLMRAKPIRFTQKAVLDDTGTITGYREVPHAALRYPFTMVRDDSPLGGAWLKSILNQE